MKNYFKKGGLFLLVLLVAFVVSGCEKKPEDVLKKMIRKMASIDSVAYKVVLGMKGQMPTVTATLGQNDDTISNNLVLNGNGRVNLEGDDYKHLMNLQAEFTAADSDLQLDFDAILTPNTTYAKVNNAPDLGLMDFNSIKGNWYMIDLKGLVDPTVVDDGDELSGSQIRKMKRLIAKTDFFTIVKDFGQDDLQGEQVYHYKVKVNTENMEYFLRELNEIMGNEALTVEQEAEMQKSLGNLENFDIEVWIGVKKYYLYKLEISGNVTDSESTIDRVDVAVDFSDYDNIEEIIIPEDVKEFNLAEIMLMPEVPSLPVAEGEELEELEFPEITDAELEELLKQMEEYEMKNY